METDERTSVTLPPVTINLAVDADIEPDADGLAVVTPLVRVNLPALLLERLAVNAGVRP